ncbi:MAG: DUF115 domain-containing protein [Proteobacteria bacterium]|nr:DUF115 domain-containing protein [Pseudomonadota bacterium]
MNLLYEKNMTILRAMSPATASWVETGVSETGFELVRTPSGDLDIRVKATGRTPFILYGAGNSGASSDAYMAAPDLDAGRATILFGLGLGRGLTALARKAPGDHVFFMVEEHAAVVRAAFAAADFTRLLATERMILLPPEETYLEKLVSKTFWLYRKGEIGILVDEACWSYFSGDFRARVDRFKRVIETEALHASGWIKEASALAENQMANLPLVLTSPSVDGLKDAMSGMPALVLSAGPSFRTSLPLLERVAGRAAIIASAPVLRVLLACGIRPDLVGILDYTPSNYDVLRDVYAVRDVPLVFLDSTYPEVIRSYQGPLISALDSKSSIHRWIEDVRRKRTPWSVGGNVGSFCLDLALHMGCDPVILVGQDLSFPDLHTHTEGIVGRRNLNRPEAVANPVWLESVGGGRVLSNLTMASYLDDMNRRIARSDRTFVNTSPNGARIRGTIERPLEAALEAHCRRPRDVKSLIARAAAPPDPALSGPLAELASLSNELDSLLLVVDRSLALNDQIRQAAQSVPRPSRGEVKGMIETLDELSRRAKRYGMLFDPLKMYLASPMAELDPSPHSRTDPSSGSTPLESMMQRNRRLMESVRHGARRLLELLGASVEAMGEIREESASGQVHTPEDRLRTARAWARLGRLSISRDHYRGAIDLAPDDPDLLIEAGRVSVSLEDFQKARRLAGEAAARRPGMPSAAGLLENIRSMSADWSSQAEERMTEDDWVSAMLLSEKALEADPENKAALRIREWAMSERAKRLSPPEIEPSHEDARRAFEDGRFQDAVGLLDGRLNPERSRDHILLLLLGRALAATGRVGEGLHILNDLQTRRPEWAAAAAELGAVLIETGRTAAGIEQLERAARLDPRHGGLLFEAGLLRMQSGDYLRAAANLEAFLADHPGVHEAYNKLGICNLARGRPLAAGHCFEKALAIKPDSAAALAGLEKSKQLRTTGTPERTV